MALRGLVYLEREDYDGNPVMDIWLVSNPEDTQRVYNGTRLVDDNPWEYARAEARDCLILRDYEGSYDAGDEGMPLERDDAWLAAVLASTRPEDRAAVEAIIVHEYWKE